MLCIGVGFVIVWKGNTLALCLTLTKVIEFFTTLYDKLIFIDGDNWLNVRIQLTGDLPIGVPRSIDSLSEIMTYLLDGTIKPSQLVMVREVVNGNVAGDSDTAQFWDIAANYNVTRLAGGTVIVTHVTESDPAEPAPLAACLACHARSAWR